MSTVKVNVDSGDILIYNEKDYEIRAVGDWIQSNSLTPSLLKMAILTVDIKGKAKVSSDGKREKATLKAVGLKATPIDPVDPELALSMGYNTPYTLKRCYLADDYGFYELFLQETRR